MSETALRKLRNLVHANWDDKRFPQSYLSCHSTERHIQIYNLVSEYINLHDDLKLVTADSVKALISNRIRDVEKELMRFWVATEDEMITNKSS